MRKVYLLLLVSLFAILLCSMAYAEDVTIQVVGGNGVENGKYPFLSAVLDETRGSGPYKQQFCTGSLIDHDTVMTAAHCARGMPVEDISVTVGKTVLSDDSQGVIRQITEKKIHPKYGDPCRDCHDVALLNFNNPVSYDSITFGSNQLEEPGRGVIIAGWGSTDAGGTNYPDRAQEAGVRIVSDDEAKDMWNQFYVSSIMVAAGRPDADTCSGDSGGPLFDLTSDGFKQIGITSYGAFPCANDRLRGVYTEVNADSNKNWINTARQ